jgi:hypothetical protein
MLNSVITGDVVRSTLLQKADETRLYKEMARIAGERPFEMYRGDSFQLYVKDAREALRVSFQIRCAARKIDQPGPGFDIRQSIGLAVQRSPVRSLASAKGDTFIFSGRAFDTMKDKNVMLVITSSSGLINHVFEMLAAFADDIFNAMTPKQAAVIAELLSGKTQQEVARKLKKAQPTINRQAQAARWTRIQELLAKFDYFIQQLSL